MLKDPITLITGANGFIGSALCQRMAEDGRRVRSVVRSLEDSQGLSHGIEIVRIGEISRKTDWQVVLSGVDTVVHLAAAAHITKNSHEVDFRSINVEVTKSLALSAVKAKVRRFIFISSIGVNGESNSGISFCEKDTVNPHTAYAISKWEAEQVLHQVSKNTGLEIVILRPPLVYGPGAPGNFARLVRLIKTGMLLPFGGIRNLRSFIYLGNLVDAISSCITHPLAAGETFLVSDGEDISTPDLIKVIACTMGKKANLFSVHPGILKALCKIAGKGEELEKLTESLLIDSSKIRKLLDWKPPFTFEKGMKYTIK